MPELTVAIANRSYRLAVTEGEQQLLESCANKLDEQMKLIREGGKVSNPDQIAVLAGLSIAYEARRKAVERDGLEDELKARDARIEELLARIEELEHMVPTQDETMEDKNQQLIAQKIEQITNTCNEAIMKDLRKTNLFQA